MSLCLFDRNAGLRECLAEELDRRPDMVKRLRITIETEMPEPHPTWVTSYVSPANSFGYMDGGIDWAYCLRFPGIAELVQQAIAKRNFGELLVGEAMEVDFSENVRLVVSPTMRVPMALPPDTINPYLATRAAIRLWERSNAAILNMPGMGTGWGKLDPRQAAHQMALGIQHGMFGPDGWSMPHKEIVGQLELANV